MKRSTLALALTLSFAVGCGDANVASDVAVPGRATARKTAAPLRAQRRAYDGAPPVIPHAPIGAACTSCHNARGIGVDDLGFAPPSPHGETPGLSAMSRCTQCHVFRETDELFVENAFVGRPQDLRHGERLFPGAPPVMPHATFMRENCQACHTGPAAREEIRTTHPERANCLQCHPQHLSAGEFTRS